MKPSISTLTDRFNSPFSQLILWRAKDSQRLRNPLRFLLLHKTKHITGDSAHLNLIGALGNAIAAVVTVDMLKGFVAGIAQTTVGLHSLIGGITAQAVGGVITH